MDREKASVFASFLVVLLGIEINNIFLGALNIVPDFSTSVVMAVICFLTMLVLANRSL